jgi:glycosyltransferase involved in cell wall biosynthesis
VKSSGLAGVVLPGAFDDVQEILQAADAFVYPVLEAGTAMAPLEAMAAGLPVVASDIPDNRHLLADGAAGMLVPPEDPSALASAIGQVLDSAELAEDLGRPARQRATEAYSLDALVDWHAELFRDLAA